MNQITSILVVLAVIFTLVFSVITILASGIDQGAEELE